MATDKNRTFQRYAIEWVLIRDLSPHPKVQRSFDEAWAKSIGEAFDPDKFRELYAVKAPHGPSTRWVFDGQHRLAAARVALGEDQKVPCRVWDSIPVERQAELFLDINRTKQVKSLDRWTVRVLAREEIVLKIEAVLHRHRLQVSKTRSEGAVQAVTTLESIWRRDGGEATLDRVLTILGDAWGRDPDAYDGLILRGLAGAVHRFGQDLNDTEIANKMARKGMPKNLVGRARNAAQIMAKSPTRGMLELVVNIYNERRRVSRLEL